MALSSTYQSTGLPLMSTLYEPPPKHLISVLAGQDLEADLPVPELLYERHQMPEVAAEPIELPDHQRVPGAERFQTRLQAGPRIMAARGQIRIAAVRSHPPPRRGHRVADRGPESHPPSRPAWSR